ncbi:MAG: hypothetical protein M5U23_06640 [Acidimicrobiia bacterium]|nr:hypothetical protein [Acidimicrobiia bacterium]
MAQKQWPTWMIVVAIIILIPPIVWGLSLVIHIAAALSIGGILLIAAIIWLFARLQKRVNS